VIVVLTWVLASPGGGVRGDDLATVTGSIKDTSAGAVRDATVTIANVDTGTTRTVKSNESGLYSFPYLPPGRYEMHVNKEGFQPLVRGNIVLNGATAVQIDVEVRVGDTRQSVTVEGSAGLIHMEPVTGTVVDRQFVGELPLNGRSFQSLIELSPGVVATKAMESNPGQFSVNGQRPDANYFTVDGVSVNFGITADGAVGQTGAGAVPGFSVAGGTNNLVSVDALQEFTILTSTFAPEYGRTPGGQVAIVTRSGTNQFHGTLFDYFRNDAMDATDWFANANRLSKPALRQNDFGGVFGGRIIRNKTFFFLSYEGLRLRQPLTSISQVPSAASRQSAIPAIQPFLNSFPQPNGANTTLGMALFTASYSNPTQLDAGSLRIDHSVKSKLNLFARYNQTPSNTVSRGLNGGDLSQISPTEIDTRTLTGGGTYSIGPSLVNEFRGNWSEIRGQELNGLDDFGGAVPVSDLMYYPATFSGQRNFTFSLSSTTYQKGGFANNIQKQLNFTDALSYIHGSHQVKFGADLRRTGLNFRPLQYNGQAIFQGATGALQGLILSGSITAGAGPKDIGTQNLSVYAQDIWKVTRGLTLTYGMRWELDDYPTEDHGRYPTALTGIDNPATMTVAPAGTPLWHTTYRNLAPRIGFSQRLGGGQDTKTVLRGGFGLFYDLPYGSVLNAFSSSWPSSIKKPIPANTPFPYSTAVATPPSLMATLPANNLIIADPNLQLPLTYQWNVTLERSLGASQTISVGYIGAAGRRLLRDEMLVNPNPNFVNVSITRNDGESDYDALQVQFRRRLASGLQVLASYTWSHSLDTASNDSSAFASSTAIVPRIDRASSDFDVRQTFNAAFTYTPRVADIGRLGNAVMQNWSLNSIFTCRTATPVNVTTTTDVLGLGVATVSRPDLVYGVPLYVDDSTVGGDRRFNLAAFSVPPTSSHRQGTLGRNDLRGFDVGQIDFSIRRDFPLNERLRVQFRGELFNVLNHPNFADPNGNIGAYNVPNGLFGISSTMLGQSLGSGGVSGGLNPLYQVGGPRSVQLSLKFQF
jgi:hypothetical protein